MITFDIEINAKNLIDDAFTASRFIVEVIKTDRSEGNVRQYLFILMKKGWHPNVIQFLDNCIYISIQQDNDIVVVKANIY